jgi:hypothetical protein
MNASSVIVGNRALGFAAWLVTISLCSGCNHPVSPERQKTIAQAPAAAADAVPASIVPAPLAPSALAGATEIEPRLAPSLSVKRFVVGRGVKDREPLLGSEPLVSDGSPIYAFVELANQHGKSQNVRVTFERRGGNERVGDVNLPVPANVARHRTWAFTRFIRAAGVWEAVLWSESGVELSRASFEVTAA